MRHLCSLCAMGGVSPTTKVGTHWVKRRECTANRRSVSASNDLGGRGIVSDENISKKKTSDANSEMRAIQQRKLGSVQRQCVVGRSLEECETKADRGRRCESDGYVSKKRYEQYEFKDASDAEMNIEVCATTIKCGMPLTKPCEQNSGGLRIKVTTGAKYENKRCRR